MNHEGQVRKLQGPMYPRRIYGQSRASLFESPMRDKGKRRPHARHDVCIRGQPYEKYFDEMRFCPVFDSHGVDTCPVGARMGSQVPARYAL